MIKSYQPNTGHYRDLLCACRAELATLGYGPGARQLKGAAELLWWLERRGKNTIDTVGRTDMEAFLRHLQSRPSQRGGALSTHTVDQYLYGAKLLFDYAERHELRGGNPLAGLARTRVAGPPRYVASRAEVERLYTAASGDERITAMLHLLYGCGLRRTEVERLDVGDVDYGTDLLYVRRGKGRKRRVVPLAVPVAAGLKNYQRQHRWRWIKEGKQCRAFLLHDRGGRMRGQTLAIRLRKLVVRAGVNASITPHGLRHAVATHLLAGGMAVERIRDFLGHDHLETTQRYTHLKPRHQ